MPLTSLCLALALPLAGGIRMAGLEGDAQAYQSGSQSIVNGDDIDWTFMARSFTYNKRGATLWGWLKKSLFSGRRILGDLKDELATQHFCAPRGTREETYYAASLCYWIPDIPDPEATTRFGLGWRGGVSDGKEFCDVIPIGDGGGRCVKCGVCHNNGRSKSREATATAFQENIRVENCLTETKIEQRITDNFIAIGGQLVVIKSNCDRLFADYQRADDAYEANQVEKVSTTMRLWELGHEIADLQSSLDTDRSSLVNIDEDVFQQRVELATDTCSQYSDLAWYPDLTDRSVTHDTIVFFIDRSTRFCVYQQEDTQEWRDCKRCRYTLDNMNFQLERIGPISEEIAQNEVALPSLIAENATETVELAQLLAAETGLRQDRDAKQAAWTTEQGACAANAIDYGAALGAYMKDHVADYYDDSCEKKCISNHRLGCGVIEGGLPADVTMTGGVPSLCLPPMLSWVKGGPYNHVTDPRSRADQIKDQCERIYAEQLPRRAQSILKYGMLSKRERLFWRWRPRFFVFESGDTVRSAMMRYWRKDPATNANEPERYEQAIILWDAKGVTTQPGSKYGWKDGTACFELIHFYRTYQLCVKPEDGGEAARDEWVQLVLSWIVYPDLGKKTEPISDPVADPGDNGSSVTQ